MRSWLYTLEHFPLPPRVLLNYLGEAWRILMKGSALSLGAVLLAGLWMGGAYFLSLQAVLRLVYERFAQETLLNLLALPAVALALGGLARLFLSMARSEEFELRAALFHWRRYLWLLAWCLAYYVTYLTLFRAAFDWEDRPAFHGALLRLRLVLGVGLFLWLLARMIFAPAYIVEDGMNLRAALKQSYLLTSGKTLRTLTFIAMGLAALGVGWAPLAALLALDHLPYDQIWLSAALYFGFGWSVLIGGLAGLLWAIAFEIYSGRREDMARRVEQDGVELVKSVESKIEKALKRGAPRKRPASP